MYPPPASLPSQCYRSFVALSLKSSPLCTPWYIMYLKDTALRRLAGHFGYLDLTNLTTQNNLHALTRPVNIPGHFPETGCLLYDTAR